MKIFLKQDNSKKHVPDKFKKKKKKSILISDFQLLFLSEPLDTGRRIPSLPFLLLVCCHCVPQASLCSITVDVATGVRSTAGNLLTTICTITRSPIN